MPYHRQKQKGILQSRLEQLRRQLPALFISLPGDEECYGGCLAAGRGFMHINSEFRHQYWRNEFEGIPEIPFPPKHQTITSPAQ